MSIFNSMKFEPKRRLTNNLFVDNSEINRLQRLEQPIINDFKLSDSIEACLIGSEVVVKNKDAACWLYSGSNFGCFVGHRMNFVNENCFVSTQSLAQFDIHNDDESLPTSDKVLPNTDVKSWIESKRSNHWLFLSLIESLYLLCLSDFDNSCKDSTVKQDKISFKIKGFKNATCFYDHIRNNIFGKSIEELECFIKRFLVYRYFRHRNWVVRDGIFFGADFLLYKDSIEKFHSSAAVRIFDSNSKFSYDAFLTALQRELATCKKSLLTAHIALTSKVDILEEILRNELPKIFLFETWQWNQRRVVDL